MGKDYAEAELVETYARRLIPHYHPELATARIKYIYVNEGSKRAGKSVLGKVRKVSGALEFLLQQDFIVEVALNTWNDLTEQHRTALVDHLLERCFGEEDEKNGGAMKWSVREPDVQEFSAILQRHGAWTEDLQSFVSIAKMVDVESILNNVVADASATAGVVETN